MLNFENLALIEPDATMSIAPPEYQDTKMSRFAVAAALYLAIGLVQVNEPFSTAVGLSSLD